MGSAMASPGAAPVPGELGVIDVRDEIAGIADAFCASASAANPNAGLTVPLRVTADRT
jgi:hypothetical protein